MATPAEKIVSLRKYVEDMSRKLSSTTVPEKHKNSEKEYRAFLKREVDLHTRKIEELSLLVPNKA